MTGHRRPRRAAALVFVLGVLFVLAGLAVSFARLTSLERDSARIGGDAARARLLAEAGIERAIWSLRRELWRPYDGKDLPWFYAGHSYLDAGNGTPLRDATQVSFQAGTAYGRPYSGNLPDTYEPLGNTYALKILDTGSMINLNQPLDPRLAMEDQPLVAMLESLSRRIGESERYRRSGLYGPGPLHRYDGWSAVPTILEYRDHVLGGRFAAKSQLMAIPGVELTTTHLALLEDFVATEAWLDPDAVLPGDPAAIPESGSAAYGFRFPSGTARTHPRSPVNVNTAPPEVLRAVLGSIAATTVRRSDSSPEALGTWTEEDDLITEYGSDSLAGTLLRQRPFPTWTHLEEAVLGSSPEPWLTLANADPNVDTRRANPDASMYRPIDKFDLTASTTELALLGGGWFEIESLGRVTSNGGEIRAEASVRAVVRIYELYRETNQRQFERGTFDERTIDSEDAWTLDESILTGGDLELVDCTFRNLGGSVHSNGDLTLESCVVRGDATASGGFSNTGSTLDGETGGGEPEETIPVLDPAAWRDEADYRFHANGEIEDVENGYVFGMYSGGGFELDPSTGTWNSTGIPGSRTYWFEGNVSIVGVWNARTVTIVATGHVHLEGMLQLEPAHSSGVTILAGTDLTVAATPIGFGSDTMDLGGIVYANEQVDLRLGSTRPRVPPDIVISGALVARDGASADGHVVANRGEDVVGDRAEHPQLVLGSRTETLRNVTTYPLPGTSGLRETNGADGWIGLAPAAVADSWLPQPIGPDSLLANWKGTSGVDAELGGGSLLALMDTAGPLAAAIPGEAIEGSLLADGLYAEHGAVPAFEATGNVGPTRGTIAFWVKPADDRNQRRFYLSLTRTDEGGGVQWFYLVEAPDHAVGGSTTGRVFRFRRAAGEDADLERQLEFGGGFLAHGWNHVVLVYDFEETDHEKAIQVYVDGQAPTEVRYTGVSDRELDPDAEVPRSSIAAGNTIRLGERDTSPVPEYAGSGELVRGPDATYSGLVVLDETRSADWAVSLYAEGRYYDGDGPTTYLSATLPIPTGAEILHLSYTVRFPCRWRSDTGRRTYEGFSDQGVSLSLTEDGTEIARWIQDDFDSAGYGGPFPGEVADGELRYRLTFRESVPGRGVAEPVIGSTFVDDVTFAYAREPLVAGWEERP